MDVLCTYLYLPGFPGSQKIAIDRDTARWNEMLGTMAALCRLEHRGTDQELAELRGGLDRIASNKVCMKKVDQCRMPFARVEATQTAIGVCGRQVPPASDKRRIQHHAAAITS